VIRDCKLQYNKFLSYL